MLNNVRVTYKLFRNSSYVALTAGIFIGASGLTPTYAQESLASLEEIVVTAQKREQSLQSTPLSIVAFSSNELKMRDITNVSDLTKTVANFTAQPSTAGGSSSGQFFIRGVGQFDFFNTNDPAIALYIDGVIIPRAAGSAFGLPDVERIEVLRGPQGTLYGRNTIAGAINIHTRAPRTDETEGEVSLTYGSRNRVDATAYIATPLVEDKLFAKFSVVSTNQDGYITRVETGEDMGDDNSQNVAATFQYLPSERVSIQLKADYMRKRGNSGAEVMTALSDSPYRDIYNQRYLIPRGIDPVDERYIGNEDETHTGSRNRDDYDHWGLTGTIDWDLDFGKLKSITAYRELDTHFGLDYDGGPPPLVEQLVDDTGHFYSQEFQLGGTALDGRLDWLVGVYYFNETSRSDVTLLFLDRGFELPDDFSDFFTFFVTTSDRSVIENNDVDTESYAFFTQETYKVTDTLRLTAGLRYTHDKKELFANHFEYYTDGELVNVRQQESWGSLSPRFAIEFEPNEDFLLYASASRGFRSGGFNGRAYSGDDNAVTIYDPEYIWAYEAGIKSDWFNNRIRLNVSGYFYDYSDFQFDTTVVLNGTTTFTKGNAASAEIKGFEAEFQAVVTPEFRLAASVGHIDSKFKKVDERVLNLPLDTKFINAPKWTVTGGFIYDIAVGEGLITLRGDMLYKSKVWFLFNNQPLDIEDGYITVDANLTYRPGNADWKLSVFGKNIFDESYKLSSITNSSFFGGATLTTYAPGAEWGINFTHNF